MKKFLLFSIALLMSIFTMGQSTANYTFSTNTTGSLEDLSTGATQLLGAGLDDNSSTVTNIGFTFVFMGVPYTQFSVSSNGLLRLGSTVVGNTTYAIAQAGQPLISPFGDDLQTHSTGEVHYKLLGTGPNQRLVVEWSNMRINYISTTADATYQLILYEGTGVIDFVYGAMAVGAGGATGPYYIGFSTNSTDNTYATVASATNVVNTTVAPVTNTYTAGAVIPNLNSIAQGSRRVYTFTPPAATPNAPSSLNFTSVTPTGMTLNWTDNSLDETGFVIFRSDDLGVTYNYLVTVAAGTVTYTATGLNPSTTYYWNVYATNEGHASTALNGNQATLPPYPRIYGIKDIPSANYPSFAVAFDSIANKGIGPGGIIFNVATGYTETATNLVLTNNPLFPPTAVNTILFQKNGGGANPVISRTDAGTLAPSILGGQGDAVIIIQGADYVTFDGIDVSATNSGIEYGYYLRKASTTDGCKNVTIKNANITLTKGTSAYVVGIYSSNNDASSLVGSATGITITSAAGRNENITITGNTIGGVFAGIILRGFGAATPYDFYDQNIVVGASGAGNTIQNYAGNTASTSYGVYLIYQNNANISYNTINNISGGGSGATGTFYGIYNSIGNWSTFTANYNNINITTSATGSALYGISTASTSDLTLEHNNITLNTTVMTSGSFGYIYNSSAVNSTSVSISNNTFTGSTIAVTGTTYLIYNYCGQLTPGVTTIQNNVTSGTINRTGATGTFYCYYNGSSSPTGTTNISNNNFSNITLTGSSTFYGIYESTTAAQTSNIFNNTISNITGGSGTMYGTYLTSANTRSVYGNTVNTFTGGGTIYGIYIGSGFPGNVYNNNVYNLSSSPAGALVYGIYVIGGTTLNIYNNFVSNLKAPAATGTNAISGIYVSSGIYVNIFYNTIYLNATSSSATTFGTSGIYVSTTSVVDLRNNIIMNVSGNTGATGYTVAYRRASTTISTYATTSNNNDFYAGTPSAKNLIFFDGTNSDQTLAAFRSRVAPADGQSISVVPPFTNISTPPYDLTIQNSIATAIESGGIVVSSPISITTDYFGDPRYPNAGAPVNPGFTPKGPDIGADEFGGLNLDVVPPLIVYTPLSNTGSTGTRTLVATITDVTGVSNTPTGLPVLYWKVNAGAYAAVTATALPSNQYSFTFGGGVLNDVISYYIVAQDLVVPPNVGSVPWAGVTSYTADPPIATPAPTNPSTYTITSSFSGTKTVGTGGDYASLTGISGAFAAINAGALSGNLTLSIIGNLTEEGTNALNQWGEEGAGNYTLTIQPDGTTERLISGAVANGMIRLNGTDRLIVDGRSGGSGKYLRFRNTNTSYPVFTFLNDATNNTIRNCYIESPSTASTGLLNFSTTTGTLGNINNTITENVFRDRTDATGVPSYMIYSSGTAARDNASNTINNNEFANFSGYGIYISTGSAGNWTITNNSFYNNLAIPPSTSQYPIYFAPGTLSTNNLISGNFIGGQSANCGGSPWVNSGAINFYGIYLVTVIQTTSIQNNTIQNLSFTNTGAVAFYGIAGAAGTLSIGTVTGNLIGSLTTPASILIAGTGSPTGIYLSTWVDCANNTIANIDISNATGAGNCYGIYMSGNYQENVFNNKIINIGYTSGAVNPVGYGYPAAGIMVSGTPVLPSTFEIYNNVISLGDDGYIHNIGLLGIWFYQAAGKANISYNSVRMGGSCPASNTSSSVAIQKQGIGSVVTKDNVFSNFRTNGAGGTGSNMAYYAADVTYITSNYNDLYASDPNAIGAWGAFLYNFAGYQAASGQEANSISADPLFISATDLRVNAGSPVLGAGTPIASITTDILGTLRNVATPSMGAYEQAFVGLVDPSGFTATPVSSQQINLTFTPNPSGNNVVIVWNLTGTFTLPSGTPTLGGSLAGGTVLSIGITSPVSHPGLTYNIPYYYKAFSYDGSVYSTGVTANATTTLAPPTAFTATPVSSTQINLAYTKNTAGNDVIIATNSTATFDQPVNGTAYPVNTVIGSNGTVIYQGPLAAFNHTGLTPMTTYYYKIWSVDAFTYYSATGATANATTTQIPGTIPFSETFETWPDNWTVVNGTQTNKWFVGTIAVPHGGSNSAYISDDVAGATYNYNITSSSVVHLYRNINFTGGASFGYSLKFWWKGQGESCCDYLKAFIVDPSTVPVAGTQLITGQVGVTYNVQGSYVEANITLPNTLTGTMRLVLSWKNDGSVGTQPPASVDDISIETIPCPTPTALTATNITTTSADLGWTSAATAWEYQYGLAGYTPTATGTATITNPTNITGLSPGTTYDFYVRTNCSGVYSDWSAKGTFTTVCVAVSSFNENFDGVTAPALPNCWAKYTSPSFFQTVTTVTTAPQSAPNTVQLYSSGATLTADAPMLISPSLTNLNAGTHQLHFFAKGASTNLSVIIGTMSDPANSATFTAFQTVSGLNTSTYTECIVSFASYAGTNTYIAFQHPLTTTYSYIYIDNCGGRNDRSSHTSAGIRCSVFDFNGSLNGLILAGIYTEFIILR